MNPTHRRDRRIVRAAVTAACAATVAAGVAACDGKPDAGAGGPAAVDAPPVSTGFVEMAEAAGLNFHMDFLPGEQGEHFKINLYDHGTGTAVCDYDGDGDDDVYLVNQLGKNALFQNDGTAKFTNVTDAAGVALGDRICVSAVFADYDADGRPDLYVTSTRGGNVLFHNEGGGRFTDVTAKAGLTLVAHSQSATWLDYDGDARMDLYVSNTAKWTYDRRDAADRYFEGAESLFALVASPVEHNILYHNDGDGRFTDVTAKAGVGGSGWGGDTVVFDYDEDGHPDLFVANMFGGSLLYRNQGDGTFRDVADKVLGRTSWGAVGAKALDYDGDGRLDLYVVDMHSDMWTRAVLPDRGIDPARKYPGPEGPSLEYGDMDRASVDEFRAKLRVKANEVIFGNTLFHNLGGGKFEEVSDRARAETFFPWSIATADFDGNGYEDVFTASGMGYPYFYWPPALLMNRGNGTFESRARDFGLDPPPGGVNLRTQIGGKPAPKSARSAAVGDFDGDGRPDFVVNSFNDRALLYMNRFPKRNYATFRLTGTKSNRDAIGAVVTLTAGGRKFVRLVESASGYLSQRTQTLHFGLADTTKIDACDIVWPSGLRQSVPAASVKVNALNEITEPGGAEKPR